MLTLLHVEERPRAPGIRVVAPVHVVELDVLAREPEAQPPERLPRRPELDGVRKRRHRAGAYEVVLVVPAEPAVEVYRQLEVAPEEVRLDEPDLGRLIARAPRHVHAPLLTGAPEQLGRGEDVEVVLVDLGRDVHRVDRGRADADHERAGVLLLDLVHQVAPLRAVLVLAALGCLKVVSDALEVVEVLQPLLRALGAVGEHAVAGPEGDLAADHLVHRVVVAAYLDLVDDDGHALGNLEDDVHRAAVAGD